MKSLREVIRNQLEQLIDLSHRFDAASVEEVVHSVRKGGKRARAYLHLHAKGNFESLKPILEMIREAAGLLSSTRDAHVARHTLEQLLHSSESMRTNADEQRSLRASLHASAQRCHDAEFATLHQRMPLARALLQDAAEAYAQFGEDSKPAEMAKQLASSYRAARQAIAALDIHPDMLHLHELRKKAKQFYYQCELASEVLEVDLAQETQRSESLTDRIGTALDVAVLQKHLEQWKETHSSSEAWIEFDRHCQSLRQSLVADLHPLACQCFFRTPKRFRNEVSKQLRDLRKKQESKTAARLR